MLASLDHAAAAGAPPSAAALVSDLASAFPEGFDDRLPLAAGSPLAAAPGPPGGSLGAGATCVTFARKAQALAAQLALRFGGADARFAFGDLGRLAADSGARRSSFGSVHVVVSLPLPLSLAYLRGAAALCLPPSVAFCCLRGPDSSCSRRPR